jgi:Uncharacterized protein conserved in bacteria
MCADNHCGGTKIKIDLEKIAKSGKPLVLELGCGRKRRDSNTDGRVGIDKLDLPNVDIVTDIENGLGFLPENSVDEIHCKSLLEHINNFENLMREVVRVLKKGGVCNVFVPHFSNPYYYFDYTHIRFFGLYTFYYFCDEKYQLSRKVPDFYTDIRIKILRQRLKFRSPFKSRHLFKQFLQLVINSHSSVQEFYEENLCHIFPCYGLEIVFTPDGDYPSEKEE